MHVVPETERRARADRVSLVRSRRALVVAAVAVNALSLAALLSAASGGSSFRDAWQLWLVLVALPLSLTLLAQLRLFRPVAVVLVLVSIGARLVFSLVAPAIFLIFSGMALAAAGLVRAA